MNDQWYVGSEHGIIHDGLQTDGQIELRLDWRNSHGEPKVAIIRFTPWCSYGCGEGARLGVRKPGATEGTSSTVQRSLRDDTVVVKRDGTDSELTVDPTPFTVVLASRYMAGNQIAEELGTPPSSLVYSPPPHTRACIVLVAPGSLSISCQI